MGSSFQEPHRILPRPNQDKDIKAHPNTAGAGVWLSGSPLCQGGLWWQCLCPPAPPPPPVWAGLQEAGGGCTRPDQSPASLLSRELWESAATSHHTSKCPSFPYKDYPVLHLPVGWGQPPVSFPLFFPVVPCYPRNTLPFPLSLLWPGGGGGVEISLSLSLSFSLSLSHTHSLHGW